MEKDPAIRQNISELILKWKLGSAAVQLQKAQASVSPETAEELTRLLNKYREIDRAVMSASELCESDPKAAKKKLAGIPRDIAQTHPAWKWVDSRLQIAREQEKISSAMRKCDAAEIAIREEYNYTKAAELLESAKEQVPNWHLEESLRERLESLTMQNEKIDQGLRIQQEISALRETGGQAAYQKALELLNDYDALGLESYGIVLFNVQEERDALLKMMVRADGSSWTYRLTPSASEEIIRLEQSIRSLEDAEKKNLRVLINNNSRLLSILIQEMERMEPDSEQAIQAGMRIRELREKNQQLNSDILIEVANRAEDYCRLAAQALENGEIKAAESNLRMARDAGKPILTENVDEYLGEVSLPTNVTDRIGELQDRLERTKKTRSQVQKEIDSIRKTFYSEDNVTVNTLFSWKMSLENCLKDDPFAPGLEQLLKEINERYNSSRDYIVEKTIYDIDHDLENGNINAAKDRLDGLNSFFSTDEQKVFLKEQLKKINEMESLQTKAESLNDELRRIYRNTADNLICSDAELDSVNTILQSIAEIYGDERFPEPQEISSEHITMRRIMQLVHDNADRLRILKTASAGSEITPEVIVAAEETEASDLASLPAFCGILANVWLKAGLSDKTDVSQTEQYFARASRLAQESRNTSLQNEISAAVNSFYEQNERGQHINLILESLDRFVKADDFIAGVDFINNNVSPDEKSNPQVRIRVDKIEQGYRKEQSQHLQDEARVSLESGDLQKAADSIRKSLDFFYSIEGAQLQNLISSRQEESDKDEQELRSFMDFDPAARTDPDEKDVSQIRYMRSRLQEMQAKGFRDLDLQGECGKLLTQIEQLCSQETDDFVRGKTAVQSSLLAGEESLADASRELENFENRNWIGDFKTEISELKDEKNGIERMMTSLKTVIAQADQFAGVGDFKSARRILNSFSSSSLSSYPAWLKIMKSQAEDRINKGDERYKEVQAKFDPSNKKTGNFIQRINDLFAGNIPSSDAVFQLQTDLAKEKLILEKEIHIENGANVYLTSIAYLDEVLRWAETIAEFSFGADFPQEIFPMEPLYQIRRIGRDLAENIPPLLIEIQPILARENKWLERRTRVRQAFQQINECYAGEGKIHNRMFKDVEQELDNISLIVPVPEEKEVIENTKMVMQKQKTHRRLLIVIIIISLIILGALYYFLPLLVGKQL